jgi:twitching motility protein PilT
MIAKQDMSEFPTSDARRQLDALLAECVRLDASDLHLAVGMPPYMRVEGLLEPQLKRPALTSADTDGIAEVLAKGLDRRPLETTGSLDGAMTGADGTRYRFNVFRRQGTLSISIRRLEDRFRSLTDLGLSDSLYRLCDLPDGLIVVAGPTGAGKSTTLATLLDRINRTRPCHMVTIEDPIEYVHTPIKALVNQRQIGGDASSFHEALVASLRQDPDVILVGEIRDLNTIRTAIVAAETGHLVFTTVHAGDCVGAIERLVSVFSADEQDGIRRQLALVLRAIVTQHLVVADGYLHAQPDEVDAHENGSEPRVVPRRRSRIVTSEVLTVTPAVANLIATAKSNQVVSAMESGAAAGMQTLEQDLARLWVSGQISETSAMAMARNPGVLRDRAARLRTKPTVSTAAKGWS